MNFSGERFIPTMQGWLALQHYHRYYFVLKQIPLVEKIVLDIACGEGYGTNILATSAEYVYGVDVSIETIEYAKKTYIKDNMSFLLGHTSSIPLESESINVVVCFETIEHHNQHHKMMKEIKRVLKKDGVLIISSPDKGFYERYLPGNTNDFHVKELYYNEFRFLLQKYFQYNHFYIQNNIIGSLIFNEDEHRNINIPHLIDKSNGKTGLIEPRFNISISSDVNIICSSTMTICVPFINYDLFAIINEQNTLINSIYNSIQWRLGRLITYPYRILIKKIKNWFL